MDFPDDVLHETAVIALRRHRPAVVLSSWPPAGNAFERQVFRTLSVETYVVLGSRRPFATGNAADYARQTTFDVEDDDDPARLLLPPEIDPAVLVLRRRAATSEAPRRPGRRRLIRGPPGPRRMSYTT